MRSSQRGLASTFAFCGIVASLAFATNADAAGECLSGPKGDTPQGKHWYYRIEHPSKRHCWYLGDEGKRASRESATAKSPEETPAEKPVPKRNSESMQPAVANARAEITKDVSVPFASMPPIGQQNVAAAPREAPAPQASGAPPQPNNWKLSERWPDAQTSAQVAQAEAPPPSPPAPEAQQAAVQQPPRQTAAPAMAAAMPAPTEEDSYDILRITLGILTAAIAIGAIIGRLILSQMTPKRRPAPRRAIWQTVDEAGMQPVYARPRDYDPSLRARAEQDVEDLLRALRYPDAQRVTSPAVSANRGQRPRDRSGARV
jgi:hypothetical protein